MHIIQKILNSIVICYFNYKEKKVMNRLLIKISSFLKTVASISANSLSMIGMFEPECPDELKRN